MNTKKRQSQYELNENHDEISTNLMMISEERQGNHSKCEEKGEVLKENEIVDHVHDMNTILDDQIPQQSRVLYSLQEEEEI